VRGLFITGTDTGVGKTVVASAIAATLAGRGERIAVFKPVLTGLDEPSDEPRDHDRLRSSARSCQRLEEIAPYRFSPPVSPHLAAETAGVRVKPGILRACATRASSVGDILIAEGVGGLLVPLADDYLVRDLAVELGFPLVVVARPGLGTISHTLMTLECARSVGLEVAAVVLTPWPDEPGAMERSNRETIARSGAVEVETLPRLDASGPIAPREDLPVERWLAPSAPARAA
jgi:dethiobiotin synthetase